MQIFNSALFWFVEGILFVVVILAVRAWAQDRALPMPTWKWVLFSIIAGVGLWRVMLAGVGE
jgi:hypothetical protein